MTKRIALALLVSTISITVAAGQVGQAQRPQSRIAVKAGRLLDGSTNPAIENAVVIINGERIEAVGPAASVPIPADARVIDLSSDTVLPGLINGHEHPTVRAYFGVEDPRHEGRNTLLQQLNGMEEPPAMQAARGVRNLRVELMCGVTTAYITGEVMYNDVHLKKMADAGVFPSPRMYLSGIWIAPTSGYYPFPQTDGPWPVRTFIRKNVEAGAHHIKLVVNHGGMITGPSVGRPFAGTSMSKEEMEAAVDEAHRLGVKVTVHASDVESETLALNAGADSIQHATALPPQILDLFVKTGASIVSTSGAGQQLFTDKDYQWMDTEANSAAEWLERVRFNVEKGRSETARTGAPRGPAPDRAGQLRAAMERKIPIAVGNDNMVGMLHMDIYHLIDVGFTPLQAISAATGMGAKALGIDQDVGMLQKGKFADIISVKGKPDQNIQDLEKINFIMVGGRNYTGLSFR